MMIISMNMNLNMTMTDNNNDNTNNYMCNNMSRRVINNRNRTPGLRCKIPVFSDPAPGKS